MKRAKDIEAVDCQAGLTALLDVHRIYTVDDVAIMLRKHRITIFTWIKRGWLPVQRGAFRSRSKFWTGEDLVGSEMFSLALRKVEDCRGRK